MRFVALAASTRSLPAHSFSPAPPCLPRGLTLAFSPTAAQPSSVAKLSSICLLLAKTVIYLEQPPDHTFVSEHAIRAQGALRARCDARSHARRRCFASGTCATSRTPLFATYPHPPIPTASIRYADSLLYPRTCALLASSCFFLPTPLRH